MSDIILGEMARFNFGTKKKYEDNLIQDYKTYIDNLEKNIISAIYGSDKTKCLINISYNLVITDEDNDSTKYSKLEIPLINFCQLHNISLNILRYDTYLDITIDLLSSFKVTYE